jgi:predicted RNA-binding protein with PIN domain
VLVAREAERAVPPRAAPQAVRRYLSFARLPDPALEVVRRVLDEDADFRASVTAAVDEERVGRAGWLFVTRPEGWQQEVEALVQKASAEELAAKEDRAERGAQRRLAGAEAAAARAEASTRAALDEARQSKAELDAERAASAPLRDALAVARTELEEVRASRSATIARLKEAEAALAARTAETRALRHELRMAQAELTQADPGGAPSRAEPGPADPVPVGAEALARQASLASAVARATAAAEALFVALADAAGLVDTDPPPPPTASPVETTPGRARPLRARRRPAALPPAVVDDGAEAAEHLVRVPGALLLVDGYNISHAQWSAHPPAEQRARLLDACAELHARCGIDVEVVFDGDRETASAGTLPRSGVRYRFTPEDVEADDVLLARVDEEPIERTVLVASSDRRVRDGALRRGANVLGARQLLAVLRR